MTTRNTKTAAIARRSGPRAAAPVRALTRKTKTVTTAGTAD
jgi:hypothetical protein